MKKPRTYPDPDWPRFKRACGDRCGACERPESEVGPLEKGHIQPHAHSGSDEWENRIPICKRCNRKYGKRSTPDRRPREWKNQFALLFLHDLRPELSCNLIIENGGSRCTITAEKQADSIRLSFGDDANLDAVSEVYTRSRYVTDGRAKELVQDLILESQRLRDRPRPPSAEEQKTMHEVARHHTEAEFVGAAKIFLEREPWMVDEGRTRRVDTFHKVWKREFVENFTVLLQLANEKAERERRQRIADRARAAESLVRERTARWTEYLLAADVPEYEEISDEDRAHVAAVRAEREAGQLREVSDDEITRSLTAFRGHRHYASDLAARQLETERAKLRGLLSDCLKWVSGLEVEAQQEYLEQINNYRDWIPAASLAELTKNGYGIAYLHESLNPSTRHDDWRISGPEEVSCGSSSVPVRGAASP
jgi:hypothetical protein